MRTPSTYACETGNKYVCVCFMCRKGGTPQDPNTPPPKDFKRTGIEKKNGNKLERAHRSSVSNSGIFLPHTMWVSEATLFFAISLNQPFTIPAFPFLNFTYHQFHNTRRWHLCWRFSYPNWWEHLFQRQLCPRWASQNFDSSRTCKQFGLVSGYLQITLIEPLPSATVQDKDPCFFRVQPRSWALDKWLCSLPII